MFNLQGSEIIFILLLALVVLGPEKLPSAIRRFTQTYGELRKMGTGFQTELKSALDEPMREMRETADLLKEQADPSKVAAAVDADATAAAMEAEREAQRQLDAERASAPPLGESAAPVLGDEPDEWADPVDTDEAPRTDAATGDTATGDTASADTDTASDDGTGDEGPVQESA